MSGVLNAMIAAAEGGTLVGPRTAITAHITTCVAIVPALIHNDKVPIATTYDASTTVIGTDELLPGRKRPKAVGTKEAANTQPPTVIR